MGLFQNNPRRHRGLSIIEVMLGLVIGAMLLTAVAAATSGAAKSMRANQDLFSSSQVARVALGQILAKARMARDIKTNSNNAADFAVLYVDVPVVVNGVEDPDQHNWEAYSFVVNGSNRYLYYDANPFTASVNTNTSKSAYLAHLNDGIAASSPTAGILARNITSFDLATLTSGTKIVGVGISINVSDSKGNVVFTGEESVRPRRLNQPTTVPVQ